MSKSKKRRAGHLRQAWFTREEAAQIDALAKPLGGFADLCRSAVLGYRPPPPRQIEELLGRLLATFGNIRGNINQYARHRNIRPESDTFDDAMEAAIRELLEYRLLILQGLGQEHPRPLTKDPED